MLYPPALDLERDKALELVEDDEVTLAVAVILPGSGVEHVVRVVEGLHEVKDFLFRVEAGVEMVEGWGIEVGHGGINSPHWPDLL